VAQGVPGSLRPRIFLTFGTTRVEGLQPYAPASFTTEDILGTHFQGLSRPQGTWFRRREPRKKSPVTQPGIDPGTVRLVAPKIKFLIYHICKHIIALPLCLYCAQVTLIFNNASSGSEIFRFN
jgi:hypothetical protein